MGKLIGNWFAHDKKPPELLSPLQKLAREHEEWSASVLTLVPPENCDDERPSESLPNYPAKSLSEAEKKISNLSTELVRAHAAAQTGMIHASSALVDLKMERESTTGRKTGVKTQQILSNVGVFLEGFSGIAEIIKSADQQFGGLAYGTVQVLATVAARKTEAEDLIEEMLEELAHAFPRLNVLEHIKPTDSLQALIIGAFEVTIAYCRATTEYCKVHSIKRVKKASLERDRMLRAASRLRRKLSEIHKECELLMMQDLKEIRRTLDGMAMQLSTTEMKLNESDVRLQEIQAKSRGIHATGEDTNNRVRDGQAWMERQERSRTQKEYLAELKTSLDTRGMTKADDAIFKVKDLLRRLSEDDMDGEYSAQMTPEMLRANKTFKEWDERPESSMLVLGGYNFVKEPGSETDSEPDCEEGVSWLSFASAWYTETALRNPGYTLSFFGQLVPTVRKQHRQTFWQVVKTFAFQLAQCTISEEMLEEQVKIISGTDFSSWNDANDVDTIEQMTDLLAALLKTVPADVRITMVIDRLDQCQWDKFTKNGVKGGLEHAARFLLQLVSHRKVGLKILLVVDSRSAVSITRDQSWVGQFLSVPKWHQKAEE